MITKMQKLKPTVLAPWMRAAQVKMDKMEATSMITAKRKICDGSRPWEPVWSTMSITHCCDAMKPMEARVRMTEATKLREPMMRVPVFREMHAQQFGSFRRATIFQQIWGVGFFLCGVTVGN